MFHASLVPFKLKVMVIHYETPQLQYIYLQCYSLHILHTTRGMESRINTKTLRYTE